MLIAFVYLYQQAGSFLLEDLYKLNLSATEQLWIFLAFSSLIKIHYSFPYLASKCVPKAPAVGTMLLSELCLKWDCIVLFAGNCLSLHLQQKVHVHLHHQFRCRSYIWFHSCFKKT
jgi:NADH:ubiquinone oxidoreductase subunit 4 (subunit M)